jgi:hypothetical protein
MTMSSNGSGFWRGCGGIPVRSGPLGYSTGATLSGPTLASTPVCTSNQ